MNGALYVVAVPIGHLDDITLRAMNTLKAADLIACEDTRQTGKLLERLGIAHGPMVSLHDHNERKRIPSLLEALSEGRSVVLVSDAGTPAISDPGYPLVKAAAEAGHRVVPIPGPSAAITALCASGLPTDRFRFVGFLPSKKSARVRAMSELVGARETLIFYVAPHRWVAWLNDAREVFGEARPAVLARELTKRHETFLRGTLAELAADPGVLKGEMVVLLGGAPEEADDEVDLEAVVRRLLEEGWSPTRAAKEAARRTGGSRDEAYALVLKIREESD